MGTVPEWTIFNYAFFNSVVLKYELEKTLYT